MRAARLAAALPGLLAAPAAATPLNDYVNKPDSNYEWHDTGNRLSLKSGAVGYVLNLTSQAWLDPSTVSVSVWTHTIVVVVPKEVRHKDFATLYITGGSNKGGKPSGTPSASDEDVTVSESLANNAGMVAATLFQIPNEPIVFAADKLQKSRSEDAIIAFAWDQFITQNVSAEWLPRLPMTKACVRAMDTVEAFVKEQGVADISSWITSGGSKRGWTTWMTAAADDRVAAIMPLVHIIPFLGGKVLHHMAQAYGGWSFAFSDYQDLNITKYLDSDKFAEILSIVDVAPYMDRLAKIPKLMIDASDDEFMMMEWTGMWWDDMKGEKNLLIAPNAEHSLATAMTELLPTVAAFADSVASGSQRPQWSFTVDEKTGAITVTIPKSQPVEKVVLRHANTLSSKLRDFRWVTGSSTKVQPIYWSAETLTADADGTYSAKAPEPKRNGWTGYYIEATFPSETGLSKPYRLTTPGYVYPNTLPFPDCHGEGCLLKLV